MATDQDIHKQADAQKTDLNDGVAAAVPRGDEAAPIRVDPMAARKAMFKKSDALRNVERANATGASPEMIAALEAEAAGISIGDPIVRETVAKPVSNAGEAPTHGQSGEDYVTINTSTGPISVSKADVDREGSVDLYLRRRAAEEAAWQDKAEITRLRNELAESNRLRQEQLQARPAGQDVPATSPASTTGRSASSGASEQELTELAATLARQIYSGDEGDARGAILQILQRPQGNSLSAADIDRSVREAVARVTPPTVSTTIAAPAANPRRDAIDRQINEMSLREYADVCSDNIARTATLSKFQELVADPKNRDRLAVDVARDALDWGRNKFIVADPRTKIMEQKRGLPSSTTASGATITATEEAALTPAQIIEMQRRHRNFGRQIPN